MRVTRSAWRPTGRSARGRTRSRADPCSARLRRRSSRVTLPPAGAAGRGRVRPPDGGLRNRARRAPARQLTPDLTQPGAQPVPKAHTSDALAGQTGLPAIGGVPEPGSRNALDLSVQRNNKKRPLRTFLGNEDGGHRTCARLPQGGNDSRGACSSHAGKGLGSKSPGGRANPRFGARRQLTFQPRRGTSRAEAPAGRWSAEASGR